MPKLTNNEKSPFTDVIVLSSADLAAIAAGAGTKVIAKIPVGGAVELVSICTVETFGTSAGAVAANGAVSVGISGTAAKHLASAVPPATTATIPRFNTGSGFTAGTGVTSSGLVQPIDQATADTNIILTVAAGSSTGAYSALTTGKIAIGIRILDLFNLGNPA
jgi:hypothetical protein